MLAEVLEVDGSSEADGRGGVGSLDECQEEEGKRRLRMEVIELSLGGGTLRRHEGLLEECGQGRELMRVVWIHGFLALRRWEGRRPRDLGLRAKKLTGTAMSEERAAMSEERAWIVQKYGGTSVGKFLRTIVDVVTPTYLETNRVAIVCSARSGKTKALGTTSLLLEAAKQTMERSTSQVGSVADTPEMRYGDGPAAATLSARLTRLTEGTESPSYYENVDNILREHLAAARAEIKDAKILEQLEMDITQDCEGLRDFLNAAKIIHEVSPRSRDVIMGIGEKLACRLVVAALLDAGIEAELVTLETVVEELGEECGADGNLEQGFYDALSGALGRRILRCKGVPVVTGYFGNVPGSLLRQVGRGYTDLCAALCAVGVRASELQIWKEVDGVFTADPRKVPTARLVRSITPEEAAELTYYGSEVIHPFTMEQAIKKLVPIRIKNVENPTGCGTVVFPEHQTGLGLTEDIARDPFVDGHVGGAVVERGGRKMPTAVTIKDNIMVVNVHSNRKTISHGFFARIFGTLNRYGVVVDLISTSEVHVSMAMTAEIGPRRQEQLREELEQVGTVSVIRDVAILSLVGKEMRHMVGVAGRMFSTLAEGNINIEMISQGANEINISCVIEGRLATKALNLIHYSILELSPRPSNMQGGTFGRSFF